MEDHVTLDVPSFSSLLITSLLHWISAQYKWRRDGFLPPLEISHMEVELPREPDPLHGYFTVLIRRETYRFIYFRTLHRCLIVSFPFLLLYGFMQPRGSAPKEGDNVMARLHVMCLGPGNPRFI